MSCKENGLLVSRYLDDDLDEPELDAFLEHLYGCPGCRGELDATHRLRTGMDAADALAGIPAPSAGWDAGGLIRQWDVETASLAAADPVPAGDRAKSETSERGGLRRGLDWLMRFLPDLRPPMQHALRFALPLLVLCIGGFWMYNTRTGGEVDVRELQATDVMSGSPGGVDVPEMNLYVIHHAANQPVMDYGEERSMIPLYVAVSR